MEKVIGFRAEKAEDITAHNGINILGLHKGTRDIEREDVKQIHR